MKYITYVVLIWLSISSASILVILSGAPAEACAFWRLTISSFILLVLGILNRRNIITGMRIHHVISGLMLALHFILWMRSLFLVEVYVSTLLVNTYPIYSLIVDVIVYRRRLNRIQVSLITLTILLVALYLNVHELAFNEGSIYALLAGLTCAVYFSIGSYARSRLGESTLNYAFNTYLSASIFTGVYSAIAGINLFNYDVVTYVFFALLAIIPMMLGHTLMNYLLSMYPASVVASIGYGEPFGAGLLAFLILGQSLSSSHIVFGITIVASIITLTWFSTRNLHE